MLIVSADFRVAAEGLWLPWVIKVQQLRKVRDKDEFAPIGSSELRVTELGINTAVDPAMFVPSILPGTICEDDAERRSIAPGGRELLDESIDAVVTHYGWQHRPYGGYGVWVSVVSLLVAGVLMDRLYRSRRSPSIGAAE
jgi:hypothetical protein